MLVLGGRGAVGRATIDELRRLGHDVTSAGRAGTDVTVDLTGPQVLADVARLGADHDVVINAAGIEDPRLVGAVAPAVYVDVSATASYLEDVRVAAAPGQTVVLGAGLAPGLSTVLVQEVGARPGDEVDVAILLGSGERHGPAAVEWTAGLAGRDLFDPPEGTAVANLRERRLLPSPSGPRTHLRADFPDHVLVGRRRGITVRSYLAVGSRATTLALAGVGRVPRLAPLMGRAPHVGDDRWSLTAVNRRTGLHLTTHGRGQSRATGVLTALAAVAARQQLPGEVVSTADLIGVTELPDLWATEPTTSSPRLAG